MFEFSMEEGGTYYMLRIYERNKDSLRLIFMSKESAKRQTFANLCRGSHVNTALENFARTFRMVIRFLFCNWDSMHMEAFL